jgi:hypothetical protein
LLLAEGHDGVRPPGMVSQVEVEYAGNN